MQKRGGAVVVVVREDVVLVASDLGAAVARVLLIFWLVNQNMKSS